MSFHHCDILERHKFLSFDNCKRFKYACLVYKVLHNLAPPPLHGFFQRPDSGGSTRASVKGDCVIPFKRTTFGQNVLSKIGCKFWNSLPLPIRECPTFKTFKAHLKQWLLENQTCIHFYLSHIYHPYTFTVKLNAV